MEGQKEARGIKLGSWNKSNNTKMEMDSETYPGSRSTHIPFSGCERTLTQPDWLRPIIWQKSGLCISPHSLLYPSSLKHQVLLYGSSLNWVFILMHKRTWQMCHYLVGAISSAAWLLSFTWKTDCWSKGIETRAGGKAPLREFWIPRGHLSTAEDDLPLLSRQRVKKKTRNGDMMIGSLSARAVTRTWMVVHRQLQLQTASSKKSPCISFALFDILQNNRLEITIWCENTKKQSNWIDLDILPTKTTIVMTILKYVHKTCG